MSDMNENMLDSQPGQLVALRLVTACQYWNATKMFEAYGTQLAWASANEQIGGQGQASHL